MITIFSWLPKIIRYNDQVWGFKSMAKICIWRKVVQNPSCYSKIWGSWGCVITPRHINSFLEVRLFRGMLSYSVSLICLYLLHHCCSLFSFSSFYFIIIAHAFAFCYFFFIIVIHAFGFGFHFLFSCSLEIGFL